MVNLRMRKVLLLAYPMADWVKEPYIEGEVFVAMLDILPIT